jgi:hypothetical protein
LITATFVGSVTLPFGGSAAEAGEGLFVFGGVAAVVWACAIAANARAAIVAKFVFKRNS